jgi:hypothetical protein
MTLARRKIGSTPDPQGRALADHGAGWDPYEVWYTRVLLPRRRTELAANPSPIAAGFGTSDAPVVAGAPVAPLARTRT